MQSNGSPGCPSSEHEDVLTFQRTLKQVEKESKTKIDELDEDQLKPKVAKVEKRIRRARFKSMRPRSGTDG